MGKQAVGALLGLSFRAAVRIFSTMVVAMMTTTGGPTAEAADPRPSVASHIPSADIRGAPVTVIDRADIEMSGISNLKRPAVEPAELQSLRHKPAVHCRG